MITKSAQNTNNYSQEILLTNSAREAWELILRHNLTNSSKILLPSYIGITDREGSGIYDPVVKLEIDHDFYELNDDLTLSAEVIENHLKQENFNLILLVHYFGFKIRNIKEIVDICRMHGVIVVEDCAHIYNYNMYDYSTAGTYGDYTFYSLHKFFSLQKGGMLKINNQHLLKPTEIISKNDLAFQLLKFDERAIAKKRCKNFITTKNLLASVSGISPLKEIGDEDIPHNYPVIIENELREKLYFWLMERNIPLIALYYRLIEPLKEDKFINMHKLSKNILNLPVHQDIDKNDIEFIVSSIDKGLKQLKR